MDQSIEVPPVDARQRIPEHTIEALAQAIAEKFHPQRIILFGSYAYGEPEPDSDLDLLVVMDTELRESEQALEIRRQLNLLFGLDLLVYTPEKLAQRLAWGDSFLQEITKNGKILYESPDS